MTAKQYIKANSLQVVLKALPKNFFKLYHCWMSKYCLLYNRYLSLFLFSFVSFFDNVQWCYKIKLLVVFVWVELVVVPRLPVIIRLRAHQWKHFVKYIHSHWLCIFTIFCYIIRIWIVTNIFKICFENWKCFIYLRIFRLK